MCVTAIPKPSSFSLLTLTRRRSRLAGCLLNIICGLDISHRVGCISFIIHHKVKWKAVFNQTNCHRGCVLPHFKKRSTRAGMWLWTSRLCKVTSFGFQKLKCWILCRLKAFNCLQNCFLKFVCGSGLRKLSMPVTCHTSAWAAEVFLSPAILLAFCLSSTYSVVITICARYNRKTMFESETSCVPPLFRKVTRWNPPTDTKWVSLHFLSCFLCQMWPQMWLWHCVKRKLQFLSSIRLLWILWLKNVTEMILTQLGYLCKRFFTSSFCSHAKHWRAVYVCIHYHQRW